MKKFEYKKAFLLASSFQEVHNEYGKEGWEIINIDFQEKECYMKREIPIEYEYKESRSFESMIKEGWEPIGMSTEKSYRLSGEVDVTKYLFRRPKP